MSREFDAAIIGAGGAGLFAAGLAGKRGRKIALIDHAPKPAAKLLVSGGGRCNFTNLHAGPDNYVSSNPHFVKSALARYTPADFIKLVESYKIKFHEKKLGQLFCDTSARDILDMLLAECRQGRVELALGQAVTRVEKTADGFSVWRGEEEIKSKALVIATGGLSFPKLGASDFGYKVAKQFGLAVTSRHAALDGFVFSDADTKAFDGLSGVSCEAELSCGGKRFRENILFTHVGLSGPAALQASLYWNEGVEVVAALGADIPRRLKGRLSDLRIDPSEWRFTPQRTVGYARAEVTRGGVDTRELSSKTMEAIKVPGLYFIGEVVDVTGQLGGFNFQWAWSSAFAAASVI